MLVADCALIQTTVLATSTSNCHCAVVFGIVDIGGLRDPPGVDDSGRPIGMAGDGDVFSSSDGQRSTDSQKRDNWPV